MSGAPPIRSGPFEILGVLGEAPPGRLLAGFDPVLRRRVWIHAVPAGTPPVDPVRRDIGRVGRLHWLTGRRAADENWDAYEAPDGQPLLAQDRIDWSWPVCKAWLTDVVGELSIATHEHSLPPLALDRLWVRDDGHAVLLDFPAPALQSSEAASADRDPAGLVAQLAGLVRSRLARTSGGRPVAMPLSASELLDRWSAGQPGPIDRARDHLAVVAQSPDAASRWRRAAPIGIAAMPAVTLTLAALAALPQLQTVMAPDRSEIFGLLQALDGNAAPADRARSEGQRRAIEIYLAGRYGDLIVDDSFWTIPAMQGSLQRFRATARRVVEAHPNVSPEALAEATTALAPDLDRITRRYESEVAPVVPRVRAFLVTALLGLGLGVPFVLGLISAAAVRGGLLSRLVGLAVVGRDGREIGRGRSILRVVLAWLPVRVWAAWLGPAPIERSLALPFSPLVPAAMALCVLAAGALWAIARPSRGPHDWLAGTWVVPR
jgi:hypothetical protein